MCRACPNSQQGRLCAPLRCHAWTAGDAALTATACCVPHPIAPPPDGHRQSRCQPGPQLRSSLRGCPDRAVTSTVPACQHHLLYGGCYGPRPVRAVMAAARPRRRRRPPERCAAVPPLSTPPPITTIAGRRRHPALYVPRAGGPTQQHAGAANRQPPTPHRCSLLARLAASLELRRSSSAK